MGGGAFYYYYYYYYHYDYDYGYDYDYDYDYFDDCFVLVFRLLLLLLLLLQLLLLALLLSRRGGVKKRKLKLRKLLLLGHFSYHVPRREDASLCRDHPSLFNAWPLSQGLGWDVEGDLLGF